MFDGDNDDDVNVPPLNVTEDETLKISPSYSSTSFTRSVLLPAPSLVTFPTSTFTSFLFLSSSIFPPAKLVLFRTSIIPDPPSVLRRTSGLLDPAPEAALPTRELVIDVDTLEPGPGMKPDRVSPVKDSGASPLGSKWDGFSRISPFFAPRSVSKWLKGSLMSFPG